MRKRLQVLLGLLVVANMTLPSQNADAHSASSFYGAWWHESLDHQVQIYNRPNLSGSVLEVARSASRNWNDVNDIGDFKFQYNSEATFSRDCVDSQTNLNGIFFASWDGDSDLGECCDTLARTAQCIEIGTTKMDSFNILFDVDEDWTYASPPEPVDVDFAAVAVHEFGHATGWGAESDKSHFTDDGDYCQFDSVRHTMCESYWEGTTYQRSLQQHDKHTFADRY
jgi:hypothetical protein